MAKQLRRLGAADETAIRDTVAHFIRAKDLAVAGRLLRQVVYREVPWVDADGRLLSLWFAAMQAERPASATVREALALAAEGSDGARFIRQQALPAILEAADAPLMDRWLQMGAPAPGAEQLEQIVAQVYVKRRQWARAAELLRQLQQSRPPSQAVFHELFAAALHVADARAAIFATSGDTAAATADFAQLQAVLALLVAAGVRMAGSGAAALEGLLLRHTAPPAFLAFVESLAPPCRAE